MRSRATFNPSHLLFALPAILLIASCGEDERSSGTSGPPPAMAVQVHVLRPQPLENTFTTTGTLLANEEVEIRSEVSGRITTIGFKEGSKVQAGQVLVRLNDDDLQAQLRNAEAGLELAKLTEGRQKQLLEVKGISQEAFEGTQVERVGMEAQVDNLKALIAKTTIRAPFTGTIGLRSISEGGFAAPTTLIATLTQTDPIKLDFNVPERFGRDLQDGTTVQFTIEGDTTAYSATIYAIEPRVDPGTRTVRVRARSPNPEGILVPGSFARVKVNLGTIADALTIPTEGLIPDIQGQTVMLMKEGKAKTTRVEIGLRTETEVQLLSGVQPGDTVVTSGLLAVKEGLSIRPANTDVQRADTAQSASVKE